VSGVSSAKLTVFCLSPRSYVIVRCLPMPGTGSPKCEL
jgi:hypothetical protein